MSSKCMWMSARRGFAPALAMVLLFAAAAGFADGGVTFSDVSAAAGITFERQPTDRQQEVDDIIADLPTPTAEFISVVRPNAPLNPRGVTGVALLDFDGDGDLDIYTINAAGTDNSLLSNQLAESGQMTFVDVGLAAGVAANSQDSSGVCFGDIDNDGHPDLYVLGTAEANLLFLNNGNGTFTDITNLAGVGGDDRNAASCSFGDIDNDGLLDLAVANTYDDWNHRLATVTQDTYPLMQHNQLFRNLGGGQFEDVSASSGIENVSNMSGPGLTGAAHSWVVSLVDYDQDGDLDLFSADNQGLTATNEAERRGWIRLFQNDGTGHFTDITQAVGLDTDGGWMGFTFGDYNCDGHLDVFSTNVGDYLGPFRHSSLFFGGADGQFTFGGPPEANVFGWGASTLDYDNDGDLDMVYHGATSLLNLILTVNPGVLLTNQGACSGEMLVTPSPFDVEHVFRAVYGVASGDLNDDGFSDIVSASSFDVIPNDFLLPLQILTGPQGSPLDEGTFILNRLPGSIMPGFVVEADPGLQLPNGKLSLEVNSGGNGNGSVKVTPRGSVGTLHRGAVNRSGIGAVIRVTPDGGATAIRPVVGGSSYASQDSLEAGFGLGAADEGLVEVHWPGGVLNRAGIDEGESLLFPEIPCDYATRFDHFGRYVGCVVVNLAKLRFRRVIGHSEFRRFFRGALSCEDNVDRICTRPPRGNLDGGESAAEALGQ